MATFGEEWKQIVGAQAARTRANIEAEMAAQHKRYEEEAQLAILQMPKLREQAIAAGKDFIIILPNVLNHSDVVCQDVDAFVQTVGANRVQAHQLAGRARIIFDWCNANDLNVFVKGVDKHDSTLIAETR